MAKEIRFAVGRTKEDIRSSVWRLWANKSELYLAARTVAGLSKISFLKSGICRFAVVSTEPRPPIKTWQRPNKSEPGITPMFRIAVPAFYSQRKLPGYSASNQQVEVLLDAPVDHTKTIISLLVTTSVFTHDDMLRTGRGKEISILGTVQLTHETAWLVAYTDTMTNYEIGLVGEPCSDNKDYLAPGGSKDSIHIRAVAFVRGPSQSASHNRHSRLQARKRGNYFRNLGLTSTPSLVHVAPLCTSFFHRAGDVCRTSNPRSTGTSRSCGARAKSSRSLSNSPSASIRATICVTTAASWLPGWGAARQSPESLLAPPPAVVHFVCDHRRHLTKTHQSILFANPCLELHARGEVVQDAGEMTLAVEDISPIDRWSGTVEPSRRRPRISRPIPTIFFRPVLT